MKKTEMLKKKYEFKRILTKGTCYKGKLLNIYTKTNQKNSNMLGIAISKKAGNSVKRNRIKRLIRESYRELETNIKTGNNIVLLWKKQSDFNDFDFYKIKEDCKNLFIKAKIFEE